MVFVPDRFQDVVCLCMCGVCIGRFGIRRLHSPSSLMVAVAARALFVAGGFCRALGPLPHHTHMFAVQSRNMPRPCLLWASISCPEVLRLCWTTARDGVGCTLLQHAHKNETCCSHFLVSLLSIGLTHCYKGGCEEGLSIWVWFCVMKSMPCLVLGRLVHGHSHACQAAHYRAALLAGG